MKKIDILQIIEEEGFEVVEAMLQNNVLRLNPKFPNEEIPGEFLAKVQLEVNIHGDLVIVLLPLEPDANFVWDVFEPKYDGAGRPKVAEHEMIQELKASGMTQQAIAEKLKVSISTVRRNWK